MNLKATQAQGYQNYRYPDHISLPISGVVTTSPSFTVSVILSLLQCTWLAVRVHEFRQTVEITRQVQIQTDSPVPSILHIGIPFANLR